MKRSFSGGRGLRMLHCSSVSSVYLWGVRLSDYLSLLTEEDKAYLLAMGQQELPEASLKLLHALMTTGSVRRLTAAQRVRLHRLRNWVFWTLYRRSFTPTAQLPNEILIWLIRDLTRRRYTFRPAFLRQLYRKVHHPYNRLGLTYALTMAQRVYGVSSVPENYLRRRLVHESRELYLLIRYQNLQWELNREHLTCGRTYCTHEAQAHLARVEAQIAKLPQNIGPTRYMVDFTRGLLHLLKGDLHAAEAAFAKILALPRQLVPSEVYGQASLNYWLVSLYQQKPWPVLENIIKNLLDHPLCMKLYPAQLAIGLHHLLRSVWLHGSQTEIQALLPLLTRKVQQLGNIPYSVEVNLALAALYLGLGHQDTGKYLAPALQPDSATGTRFEACILQLIWEADREDIDAFDRAFRRTYRFLHKHRESLISAPLFLKVLRSWPRPGVLENHLPRLVGAWEAHLAHHPSEALLWVVTPLPLWIEARLTGTTLRLLLQKRPPRPELIPIVRRFCSHL